MKEEYRNIKGYENYQVSNLGNVKSLNYARSGNERVLKANPDGAGYLLISLHKDTKSISKRIHQLVAIAFLNHTASGFKLVVNHKNFNKADNRVNNLEIVTSRENLNKKHIKSSSQYIGVSWYKIYNKWRSAISINGKKKHLGYFDCELAAAKAYQNKLKEIT